MDKFTVLEVRRAVARGLKEQVDEGLLVNKYSFPILQNEKKTF